MSKNIELLCSFCGCSFFKESKEYKRVLKSGRDKLYCSLKCSGLKSSNVLMLRGIAKGRIGGSLSDSHRENISISLSRKNNKEYLNFKEYLRRIRNRNKDSDIDEYYLNELWNSQNGKCALTNIPLFLVNYKTKNKDYNHMASLDRKDSLKGYVKENVQFLSVSCNWLKNKMPDEFVREFIDKCIEYKN